jgi:hypothetical protein
LCAYFNQKGLALVPWSFEDSLFLSLLFFLMVLGLFYFCKWFRKPKTDPVSKKKTDPDEKVHIIKLKVIRFCDIDKTTVGPYFFPPLFYHPFDAFIFVGSKILFT